MYSKQPAIRNLRVIVDGALRFVVEIDGERYYRSGPRYNEGHAVYPVGINEVVDITDFATALRCRREFGLPLEEVAEVGHAEIVSEERFCHTDDLTSPVDFTFDHPGQLAQGVRVTYRKIDGTHESCSYA